MIGSHWRVLRGTGIDKVYIDSGEIEAGDGKTSRSNIDPQIRAHRTSARWCRTEAKIKTNHFLFFLRGSEQEIGQHVGRLDLEMRINSSTFGLDLFHFQVVYMNTSHMYFIFYGFILQIREQA